MKTVDVHQLKQKLSFGERWLILDVRQPEEFAICNFEEVAETRLLPLQELHRLTLEALNLPADRPVAVCCHHGVRSTYAIEFLEQQGFENLYNLEGGIHAWATEVNDLMPVY